MRQQVVKGRKFDQVVQGARRVFLRDGYEGASVDEIAREGGVSKATLYSYFPDKRLMFAEVFRLELADQMAEGIGLTSVDAPVETLLPVIAQALGRHIVSEFGVKTYRLAIGEATRFPDLAGEYYQAGPLEVRSQLAGFLARCVTRGELAIDDLELAADQFLELTSATIQDRAHFLGPSSVSDELVRRIADEACRTFLARYAAPGRPNGGGAS